MTIDPALMPMLAEMGVRLTQLAITNASAMIYKRVEAITAGKNDQKTVNELRDIINELLAERAELLGIARAFEEQLVSQQISDKDINYIINTVVPVLRDLIKKTAQSGDAVAAKQMQDSLDVLTSLLSVEIITVLQLIGFNYKKAIGEPLTLLVQRLIEDKTKADPQTKAEINRLNAEFSVAMTQIAQDEEATARLGRAMAVWRITSDGN